MSPNEIKKYEAETLAYKQFMKVAKKVYYAQYGKWEIVPSPIDPLRKFTLEKKTEWFTFKLSLSMEEYYHRGNYTDSRYDYRPILVYSGLHNQVSADKTTSMYHLKSTSMKLKPRMASKLIERIDTILIPRLYEEIENDKAYYESNLESKKVFNENVNKINGLKLQTKQTWESYQQGVLKDCPFILECKDNTIVLQGSLSYDEFAIMAKNMGWGK